ncbi:uncharacterized protein F4822DRAFT_429046 [Hypoxylon trugodes]|uniref:uncharacterized protein n=1 Tax=Hypoxylon trugodes TaxID=326681 RepID=UPI00219DE159|nr:uncharacterized protein F4822DRAFT_429046 [Hypoxylon trugodes]KAI1388420.1 hypothetical protein F4822DRAFT_429046 [Hypoxylon trugodes]
MPTKQKTVNGEIASWEDPHPGQRLQIPLGVAAGLHIYPQTISGDVMGGVAVKARSACSNNGPLTIGCNGRGRHRSVKPSKPLKIPAKVVEEPEARGVPLVSPQPCGFMIPPLHLLSHPEPVENLEYETDTGTDAGTETGTLFSEADTDRMSVSTVGHTRYSDYSNYLCNSHDEERDDASMTVVDSEAFTRANSVDDAYGWEAELDRKMSCRVSMDSMCPRPYHQGRKIDGSRRSLLHRVFSVSGRRINSGF